MRILFLKWDGFGEKYIIDEFRSAGCEVVEYVWPFGKVPMRENEELLNLLIDELKRKNYHFVFSLNFFPVAANACYKYGTKYVSWIYDTPYLLLYSKHVEYVTNRVYFFDKVLYTQFKERGLNNVFYMPMAAPVEYYDTIQPDNEEKYVSEISFVGSTYQEERQSFYKYLDNVKPYIKGYLEAIMNAQKNIYGSFILEELLTEDIVSELQKACPIEKGEDEWESDAWIYANYFLARELTGRQRVEILKLLSEYYQIDLYTNEAVSELETVNNRGVADYETEMPFVFKNSKINLNITLRSIQSGIPLRAMDIMGCGGFLLTNYQEDFLDYFEPDVDYVYYTDNEDLLEKVQYYLEHEDERKAIAESGYRKMKQYHTYEARIRTILSEVLDEEEIRLNDLINELEDIREKQGGKWYEKTAGAPSVHEMCVIEDRKLAWQNNEREVTYKLKDCMVGMINKALESGGEENYEKILSLLFKNVSGGLRNMFQELSYVSAFMHIYLVEKEKGLPHAIANYTSCEQLQRCYQQITFYFRRIERDLPLELQMEMISYLQNNNINQHTVMCILEHCRVGCNREEVLPKYYAMINKYMEKVKESI